MPASSATSRSAAAAGSYPGSTIPVTGVQRPSSARRTTSRRVRAGFRTTAVTPGIHSSSLPILSRSERTKSGVAMMLLLAEVDGVRPRRGG